MKYPNRIITTTNFNMYIPNQGNNKKEIDNLNQLSSDSLVSKIAKQASRNANGLLKLNINNEEINRFNGILNCVDNYEKHNKSFCRNRICQICNALKATRMSKKYFEAVLELELPIFLTLTIPARFRNEEELRRVLNEMTINFSKAKDVLRKRNVIIKGIRKLEIAISNINRAINSHFHIIMNNSNNEAQSLINEWIKRNPNVDIRAQSILPIANGDEQEVLNYLSKPFVHFKDDDGNMEQDYERLLTVYRATYKRRVYQNYGGFRAVMA